MDAQGLKWAGTSCALDSTVGLEWLALPECITQVTGQTLVPFGVFAVRFRDVVLASEVCEELFTPNAMNIPLYLNGVDVICNGSVCTQTLGFMNCDSLHGLTFDLCVLEQKCYADLYHFSHLLSFCNVPLVSHHH